MLFKFDSIPFWIRYGNKIQSSPHSSIRDATRLDARCLYTKLVGLTGLTLSSRNKVRGHTTSITHRGTVFRLAPSSVSMELCFPTPSFRPPHPSLFCNIRTACCRTWSPPNNSTISSVSPFRGNAHRTAPNSSVGIRLSGFRCFCMTRDELRAPEVYREGIVRQRDLRLLVLRDASAHMQRDRTPDKSGIIVVVIVNTLARLGNR